MQTSANTLSPGHRSPRFAGRLYSALGGILLGLAYPPYNLWPLAWIALVPVLRAVRTGDVRSVFLQAWIFYLAVFLVAFPWPLTHLMVNTALVSGLAWIALTLCLAVPFGLAAGLGRRLSPDTAPWLAGGFVLLLEWLLQSGPVPMPWSALANTQSSSSFILRAAAVTGAEGLSAAIVATGALLAISPGIRTLYRGIGARTPESMRLLARPLAAIAVPLAVMFTGILVPTPRPDGRLRIAILQPGTAPASWADVYDQSRVDSLMKYSSELLERLNLPPDILVWPETALPLTGPGPDSARIPQAFRRVSSWAGDRSVAVLTGAITGEFGPAGDASYKNSAAFFSPDGNVQKVAKHLLVPFAEHVPLSESIPGLVSLAVPSGGIPGYVPGTAPSVVDFAGHRFGVLICFESAFPGYTRSLVRLGSDVLVVLTQDGWWRGGLAAAQHFEMGKLRAAEQGRSIVQVGVDGYSGTIDADGTIRYRTGRPGRESAVIDVPVYRHSTFYASFGYTFSRIALGIWMAAIGLYGFLKHRKTKP